MDVDSLAVPIAVLSFDFDPVLCQAALFFTDLEAL